MPPFRALKRIELIRGLKKLGFEGPEVGGKHAFMIKDGLKLVIPNPHGGDISIGLLARLLKQANITKTEWESV